MKDMRYLNLFEQIMGVRTRYCFNYNENIVFCVPRQLVAKSIGPSGRNIRRMSEILRKRVKIVAAPKGIEDVSDFIRAVVSPLNIKNIELKNDEIVVTAGESKASMIGRNKRRFLEMQKILKDFFGKEFRIA